MAVPMLKISDLTGKDGEVYSNRIPISKAITYMHQHDFIEIAYVVSGNGFHIQGETERAVEKGSICIIDYNVPHAFRPADDSTAGRFVICNCVFKPEFIDSSLTDCRSFAGLLAHCDLKEPSPGLQLEDRSNGFIYEIFEKLYFEYTNKLSGYLEIMRCSIIELFIRLERLYLATDSFYMTETKPAETMCAVTNYIKANYKTKISLAGLASMVYLSPAYLCKLFKSFMGINLVDYIQQIRISHACELLKTTALSVSEISDSVGYSDIKYFYKLFRKLKGTTPGEYRKNKAR